MRIVAVLVSAIAVLVVIYLLVRGPQPESAGRTAAKQSVETLARDRLATLEHGDMTHWALGFATDGRFVPSSARFVVASPESAAVLAPLEPGAPPESAGLRAKDRWWVGTTRRARIAWVAGDLGRRPTSGGPDALPLRVTTAWMLDRGTWRVILEHHSRPLTEGDEAHRVAPGLPALPAHGFAALGTGRPEPLVRRFLKTLEHLSNTRVDAQAIVVGPTDGEFAAGDSAVKELLTDWERRYGSLTPDRASLMSWTARGGGVGWVVADVTARPPGPGTSIRLRISAVYRERSEDSWSLVLAHVCDPAAAEETTDEGEEGPATRFMRRTRSDLVGAAVGY